MTASGTRSQNSHQKMEEAVATNERHQNSAMDSGNCFHLQHRSDSMVHSRHEVSSSIAAHQNDEQQRQQQPIKTENDHQGNEEEDYDEEPLVIASEEIQPVKVAESGREILNVLASSSTSQSDSKNSHENSPSKSSHETANYGSSQNNISSHSHDEDRSQAKRQFLVDESSSILALVERMNELLATSDSVGISTMDSCNLIYECDICKKLSRNVDEYLSHRQDQQLCQPPIQRCTPYQHQHQLNQHNRLASALREISRSTSVLNTPQRVPKFASSDLFRYQSAAAVADGTLGRRKVRLSKTSSGATGKDAAGPVTIVKRAGISKNDPRRKYPCYLCSKKLVHLKDVARHVIMKHKVPKRHDWEELVMKKMAAEMHSGYKAE